MKMYKGLISDLKWGFEQGLDAWVEYHQPTDKITNCGYVTCGGNLNDFYSDEYSIVGISCHNVSRKSVEEIVKERIKWIEYHHHYC